jgi:ATP synthase protein I
MKSPKNRRGTTPDMLTSALRYSALGLQMAFSVLVGFGIGYLLDRELHTQPWMTVLFSILGMGAAFFSVYNAVRELRHAENNAPKK